MSKAAVFTGIDKPLEILECEVEAPHAGEVKVRMAASGVCHSDLSVVRGIQTAGTPMVLGHEGAGVIEELGQGVTEVSVGDHVVISWVPQCGKCYMCIRGQAELCEIGDPNGALGGLLDGTTRITSRGEPIKQMAFAGTFAEIAVVPVTGVVKVPKDLDLKVGALIGCGVLTGVGAAVNTAQIRKEDFAVVVGCGGVGLNIIQGARLAGAGRIIAVDTNAHKLEMATFFGATDLVDASKVDAVSEVIKLTGGRGADVAFEAIGLESTVEQTVLMTRRGGQAILAGLPKLDAMLNVPVSPGIVRMERSIKGSWYGTADVQRDVPRFVEYYKSGQLKLDELVSRTISLDDVNEALETMETSDFARSVIVF